LPAIHYLHEAERLADRMVILQDERIPVEGIVRDVAGRAGRPGSFHRPGEAAN